MQYNEFHGSRLKAYSTRKLSYRKDDRAMRPIYGCMPWKFSTVPKNLSIKYDGWMEYAHGYFSSFSKFIMGFCFHFPSDPMNVRTKFEVLSFIRSWDNRGYRKGQSPDTPTPPCLRKIFMAYIRRQLLICSRPTVAAKTGDWMKPVPCTM